MKFGLVFGLNIISSSVLGSQNQMSDFWEDRGYLIGYIF